MRNRTETERRRRARLATLLRQAKAKPCMDCGGSFPSYVMHFDHRDPNTKRDKLSNIRRAGLLIKEMAKCDLVCANCHAIRTHETKAHLNGRTLPIDPPQGDFFLC